MGSNSRGLSVFAELIVLGDGEDLFSLSLGMIRELAHYMDFNYRRNILAFPKVRVPRIANPKIKLRRHSEMYVSPLFVPNLPNQIAVYFIPATEKYLYVHRLP